MQNYIALKPFATLDEHSYQQYVLVGDILVFNENEGSGRAGLYRGDRHMGDLALTSVDIAAYVGFGVLEVTDVVVNVGDVPAPVVYTHTSNLSQADILTLGSKPFEILQAPGEGKVILVHAALLSSMSGETRYTIDPTETIAIGVDGNTWAYINAKTVLNHLEKPRILQVIPAVITHADMPEVPENIDQALIANRRLIICTYNGIDPTGGDGTLKVTVFYSIVTL